jgi:hypothetical protein
MGDVNAAPDQPAAKNLPGNTPARGRKPRPIVLRSAAGVDKKQLDEYSTLARAVANQHATDVKAADSKSAPKVDDLVAIMDRLAAARSPVVRAAIARLENGRNRAFQAAEQVQELADAARQNLDNVLQAAGRGEYSERIERTRVVVDSTGFERKITSNETVDHSGLPVLGATVVNLFAQMNAPREMLARFTQEMETARLETWYEMVPRLAEVYGKTPANPPIVEFQITPPDPARGGKPDFTVRHFADRPLTNVTLVTELVHFTTAPESTAYEVFFIPKWDVNQAIHLPVACVRNRKTEEYTEGRPLIADPEGNYPNARAEDKNPWLGGLGGVVEIRSQVWALETHQPVHVFPFPDQTEAAALWEMKTATRMVRNLVGGRTRSAAPDAKLQLPPGSWSIRAACRILKFAAPNSESARQARLLLEDPAALLQDTGKKGHDELSRMTKAGNIFIGEWKFEVASVGSGVEREIRDAVNARKGSHGRIALRIDSRRSDEEIMVTFYDPEAPNSGKQCRGKIRPHIAAGKPHLLLADSGERPKFSPDHLNLLKSPFGASLLASETGLQGRAFGYPFKSSYWFALDLKLEVEGTDVPVVEVTDELLMAMAKPGATYTGTWRMFLEGFGRGVPVQVRRDITARKDSSGSIKLTINSCDKQTREVEATISDAKKPDLARNLKGRITEDRLTKSKVLYFPGEKPHGRPGEPKIPKEFLDFFTAPGDVTLQVRDQGIAGKLPGPIYPACYWYVLELSPE